MEASDLLELANELGISGTWYHVFTVDGDRLIVARESYELATRVLMGKETSADQHAIHVMGGEGRTISLTLLDGSTVPMRVAAIAFTSQNTAALRYEDHVRDLLMDRELSAVKKAHKRGFDEEEE